MKKLVLFAILLAVLLSCGPHRMRCGPKGICNHDTQKNHNKIS